MQRQLPDDTETELKAILSADQYAKYQSQRVALKRKQRPGRRPRA
ncbi:hypothetical protein [Hymenobacter chitinivorans]|uniref:Uncharacterized protein n=1 Tax=Hymenobacter chitinivorans DSM 11115 TaxID=1121954 RepID=A0A2M9BRK2_9BACT|nr:hypothetical protein [Hymenobacter chitinivorans]PJJ60586.1 hypothetical protein CLV45_2015 [Hymenobacter chitinivorans DSM 11115]